MTDVVPAGGEYGTALRAALWATNHTSLGKLRSCFLQREQTQIFIRLARMTEAQWGSEGDYTRVGNNLNDALHGQAFGWEKGPMSHPT
jgi:hypothetical protein